MVKAVVAKSLAGVNNLFLVSKEGKHVEVAWVRFE
jgi:hypothetical protein